MEAVLWYVLVGLCLMLWDEGTEEGGQTFPWTLIAILFFMFLWPVLVVLCLLEWIRDDD